MSLTTSLVDIDNISSPVPRSQFSEADLGNMAEKIIESGGLVQPIILKRTGIETCEIVEGHFEYYATLKATEIDPDRSDMIRAFIIEPDKEEVIKEQLELITSIKSGRIIENPVKVIAPDNAEQISLSDIREIKTLVQQFGKSIQDQVENLTNNVQKLEERNTVKGIDALLKKQLEVIGQEVSRLRKQEALKLLRETQNFLSEQVKGIAQQIDELNRLNLLTATKEEIEQTLRSKKFTPIQRNAICEAIDHWKQPGKQLTWENLEKSTKTPRGKTPNPDRITNFNSAVYKKLQEFADIKD